MRLVFAGTPEPAVPSLRALLESASHEVAAVVTRPDAPSGRGRATRRSPVGQCADEYGLEVLAPERPGDEEFQQRLREIAPDACPVVAYGGLLPKTTLDIPAHGWVNLHFSLLPAWRGAAPVQATIRAGDELAGATTFRVVREMDAGPVFGTVTEEVGSEETAGELLWRLAHSGANLLVSTMDGIADGSLRTVEQPCDGVSYARKVDPDDAHVDFGAPARAVHRHVRSVTPDPGAWTWFREQRLKLGPVRMVEPADLAPGELRVERKRVLVGTATSPVELGDVQAQGKKRMAATDWARGTRIDTGEALR